MSTSVHPREFVHTIRRSARNSDATVRCVRSPLCAVVLLFVIGCSGASAHGAAPKLQVLFVGNSLTAANDLPAVVASLSRGAIAYRTVAPGGVSLEDHWTLTGARDALDGGTWDYVVLQQGPS